MTKKSRPRAGSLAFYPRKRAKREMASYKTVPVIAVGKAKAINFLGYKAGMTHVIGKDQHAKGKTFGQDISIPGTVIECPPLQVFGARAYSKKNNALHPLAETHSQKNEKELLRKIRNFRKKSKKEKKAGKEKRETSFEDLEKKLLEIEEIRLLAFSNPKLAGFGRKKPDVFELRLSGSREQQLAFAREKIGKEISVRECFDEKQFVDVKAVTKGKGFQGVIKRFGVKTLKPKSKKQRVVGSIGPWNPSTVMWTVARPGQHGYHTRTEYNKRILLIGDNATGVTPDSGFKNYGIVSNDFLLVAGSIPGPAKRAVSLRHTIRVFPENRFNISGIDFIASKKEKQKHATEEEVKAQKAEAVKEDKQEKKSVEQEIAEAVKK